MPVLVLGRDRNFNDAVDAAYKEGFADGQAVSQEIKDSVIKAVSEADNPADEPIITVDYDEMSMMLHNVCVDDRFYAYITPDGRVLQGTLKGDLPAAERVIAQLCDAVRQPDRIRCVTYGDSYSDFSVTLK